ncbi:gag-pol polyprotein, partial [Trifolium medium]|nr:gag-pol polyprotein [Trifolium medium]
LSEPPVLSRPDDEEILYLYLSVASEAVSAALVRETHEGQKPVYFTSKALQGPELRYQQIEKIALAKALKAQVIADFVTEMTNPSPLTNGADKWTIFVDGASNATGTGAGIILENENDILIEVSLALSFPTSNNQVEYEAFLAGLRLAEDIQVKEIIIYTDSQL